MLSLAVINLIYEIYYKLIGNWIKPESLVFIDLSRFLEAALGSYITRCFKS